MKASSRRVGRSAIGVATFAFTMLWARGECPAPAPAMPPHYSPTLLNNSGAPGPAPKGMIWIPGGEFSMGSENLDAEICGPNDPVQDAQPIHRVYVDGFWMDANDVTNEEFAKFVTATEYVTLAERAPRREDFPDVPIELLVPGSLVFTPPAEPVPLNDYRVWWRYVPGASWRHPEGPGSDLRGRAQHPVVQVAYADALAYAKWDGCRLPTEAEWEFAARGGRTGEPFVWGRVLKPHGKWAANIWQGSFPDHDIAEDGYSGTSSVGAFPPNGFGLYDMAGNVWQWCSDWYRPDTYQSEMAAGLSRNPSGPESSLDPEDSAMPKRVQRGGSFLCTAQYCTRYLVGSRGRGDPTSAANNCGFRCVKTVGN